MVTLRHWGTEMSGEGCHEPLYRKSVAKQKEVWGVGKKWEGARAARNQLGTQGGLHRGPALQSCQRDQAMASGKLELGVRSFILSLTATAGRTWRG